MKKIILTTLWMAVSFSSSAALIVDGNFNQISAYGDPITTAEVDMGWMCNGGRYALDESGDAASTASGSNRNLIQFNTVTAADAGSSYTFDITYKSVTNIAISVFGYAKGDEIGTTLALRNPARYVPGTFSIDGNESGLIVYDLAADSVKNAGDQISVAAIYDASADFTTVSYTLDLSENANINNFDDLLYFGFVIGAEDREFAPAAGDIVIQSVIPEPATLGLLGIGAIVLIAFRRRLDV